MVSPPQTIRVLRQATLWSLDEFGANYRRPDHQFREPQDNPIKPTKVLFRNADKSKAGRSQYLPVEEVCHG
jgi:hypothetical protein